jgi:hypothetical protein
MTSAGLSDTKAELDRKERQVRREKEALRQMQIEVGARERAVEDVEVYSISYLYKKIAREKERADKAEARAAKAEDNASNYRRLYEGLRNDTQFYEHENTVLRDEREAMSAELAELQEIKETHKLCQEAKVSRAGGGAGAKSYTSVYILTMMMLMAMGLSTRAGPKLFSIFFSPVWAAPGGPEREPAQCCADCDGPVCSNLERGADCVG